MAEPTLEDVLASLQAQYGGGPPADTTIDPSSFNAVPQQPPQQMASIAPAAPAPVQQAPLAPAVTSTPQPATPPQVSTTPSQQYATSVANSESNSDPNAKNPLSSASGKWQITDGTFADLVKNHPDHHYALGKNDPQVMEDLTDDNTKALRLGLGRQPNQVEIFTAHFLGPAGAIRFLQASPDTPADQVVSPDALARNHNVFYNKAGQINTVGQVLGWVNSGVFKGGNGPVNAQAGAPTGTVAGIPQTPQSPGDALFGQQKQDISKYIAGQPEMWSKLADMQNQYKQAAQPTQWDRLADAMNQFQQQQAVAQANMHATAGGVLNHELPNADAFVKSLQAGHTIDTENRKARLDLAQQAYQMDSGALQAKNTVDQANLGLTGTLAKETGEYNLAAGKNALQLAQFGLEQQKGVNEQLEKLVPNPETRAVVSAEFARTANPNAGYNANMQVLNGIIQRVQKGTPGTAGTPATTANPELNTPGSAAVAGTAGTPGMQLSVKEPATLQDVTLPDGKGGFTHEIVNTSTPEGIQRIKYLATQPGYAATQQGAPAATTVTNTNVTGTGSGGGTNAPLTPIQEQRNALSMQSMVQSAQSLLQIIKQDGGTGPITGSPAYKSVMGLLEQAGIVNPADHTTTARQVFAKVMAGIQNAQTSEDMKATGAGSRGGYAMFAQINKGNLDDTALTPAVESFLDHQANISKYNQQKAEYLIQAEQSAKEGRLPNFTPAYTEMQYNQSHRFPSFAMKGLDTYQPPEERQNPNYSGPTKTLSSGTTVYWHKEMNGGKGGYDPSPAAEAGSQ